MMPLLTPQNIAKLIGVSYRQVLMLIAKGELLAFRLGNSYRIAENDLKDYLEASRYKSEWPK